jgi:hypothetical protein
VTAGAGSVTNADVTEVVVTCTINHYSVGGTMAGLVSGGSMTLRNNGGVAMAVSANGSFTFPTQVASGQPYAVTVATNPTTPVSQTCMVTSGAGVVADRDVTSVQVTCKTDAFLIGGAVSGLTGTGLVLQDNGGDDLAIARDGAFTFPTRVESGATYNVTVRSQPSGQACTVTSGTGTVGAADVLGVRVACVQGWSTSLFPITVPGGSGWGDLALDNHADLLAAAASPARAVVRVNHTTGAQTTVATGIGTSGNLLGVAYRTANDTIYTSTDDGKIFAVTATGTVTQVSTVTGSLNAITIAPPGFGSFEGFIIGVTQSGVVVGVNPANGTVSTIAQMAGAASDLAFAPDGTLYISGGATVRMVTAGGVVTPFVSGLGSADGITISPDGARMFIADSGTQTARQVTIPGAVVTTVGAAGVNPGTFVGGILAAPGNTLILLTGSGTMTLVAFPY